MQYNQFQGKSQYFCDIQYQFIIKSHNLVIHFIKLYNYDASLKATSIISRSNTIIKSTVVI